MISIDYTKNHLKLPLPLSLISYKIRVYFRKLKLANICNLYRPFDHNPEIDTKYEIFNGRERLSFDRLFV